jgi:DNA-binding MarR family transcriptional regulator
MTSPVSLDEALETYRDLLRACERLAGGEWLRLDLTMGQMKSLMALYRLGPMSVGEVARTLGVGLPAASVVVDRLVHLGLVARREDPADRRRTMVALTPEGTALIERLREGSLETLRAWFGALTAAERASLTQGARALLRAAQAPHRPAATAAVEARS